MIVQGILVATVYYICSTVTWFGVFHVNRPIVIAPLIGLILGDFQAGLIMGATFETVFLGVAAIGASVPADVTVGATIGTSLAILSNLDMESALALAIPVSIVGLLLMTLPILVINPIFHARMLKHAEEGNDKAMEKFPIISGILQYLFPAIIVGVAVAFGVDAVNYVFAILPPPVLIGLGVAGGILPALGMALMLNMLFDKKVVAFFFLGFVLTKYLELPSIVMAVIAITIGLFTFAIMPKNEAVSALSTVENEEEDFFS